MNKEMTCVACPLGCNISVEIDGQNRVLSVTGNDCKRGRSYAESEISNPTRSLTGTVKVTGSNGPLVPVKSREPIPKARLVECAFALKDVTVKAPVRIGDAVVRDILGTGVDMVATSRAVRIEN